eukprot:scaffold397998_cov39-Attheya_sp.AAC.1
MGTTGLAIYHLEQETDELPLSISLSLVAAAFGVVIFIPESGGWLLLFPAYLAEPASVDLTASLAVPLPFYDCGSKRSRHPL